MFTGFGKKKKRRGLRTAMKVGAAIATGGASLLVPKKVTHKLLKPGRLVAAFAVGGPAAAILLKMKQDKAAKKKKKAKQLKTRRAAAAFNKQVEEMTPADEPLMQASIPKEVPMEESIEEEAILRPTIRKRPRPVARVQQAARIAPSEEEMVEAPVEEEELAEEELVEEEAPIEEEAIEEGVEEEATNSNEGSSEYQDEEGLEGFGRGRKGRGHGGIKRRKAQRLSGFGDIFGISNKVLIGGGLALGALILLPMLKKKRR